MQFIADEKTVTVTGVVMNDDGDILEDEEEALKVLMVHFPGAGKYTIKFIKEED